MIDIHPPHHGAMTRRDIFTHLAIVVAGILIAIGLEQAVEAVHHARERRELIVDMRDEASRNVLTLHRIIDVQIHDATWRLAVMKTLQTATPHAGVVTVTLPPRKPLPFAVTGDRAVWAIAQANGNAALLSEQEAETYYKLDHEAEDAVEARALDVSTQNDLRTDVERLRLRLSPDATVTVPVAELPGLLKAMAARVSSLNTWAIRQAIWAGAADAVAKGEQGQALIDSMDRESSATSLRILNEY
jgi:hypothetical protein